MKNHLKKVRGIRQGESALSGVSSEVFEKRKHVSGPGFGSIQVSVYPKSVSGLISYMKDGGYTATFSQPVAYKTKARIRVRQNVPKKLPVIDDEILIKSLRFACAEVLSKSCRGF